MSAARAGDCSPVDMAAAGGSMRCAERATQEHDGVDSGTCGGFTETLLFDAWNFDPAKSCAEQPQSSPLEAALLFLEAKHRSSLPGADGKELLELLVRQGSCPHAALFGNSELFSGLDYGGHEMRSLFSMSDIYAQYKHKLQEEIARIRAQENAHGEARGGVSSSEDIEAYIKRESEARQSIAERLARDAVCRMNLSPFPLDPEVTERMRKAIERVALALQFNVDSMFTLSQMFDALCEGKRTQVRGTPPPTVAHEARAPGWDPLGTLDRQLGTPRPQPVSALFCYKTLMKADDTAFAQPDGKGCTAGMTHYAPIIGRRKVGSSCQLEIQNSFGCEHLNSKVITECDPKTNRFWIDQDRLSKNILELDYLK